MDAKHHWAWSHFSGPAATRAELLVHYQQEYITYIRDFPQFLGRVHGRCPDPGARRLLAENLFEEETGGLSRTGPHPELFIRMMQGLGFPRSRFELARPLPAAASYRWWLDEVTTRGHWVVSAAVVTIFVEGSVNDRSVLSSGPRHRREVYEPRKDPLAVHHGLRATSLTLKRAHALVENGHRVAAWEVVDRHAATRTLRDEVIRALSRSLRLWLAFREGVARAAGLVPPASLH